MKKIIESEIIGILSGQTESEAFCKNMVESLTVYQDRRMDLRLTKLPHVFRFIG